MDYDLIPLLLIMFLYVGCALIIYNVALFFWPRKKPLDKQAQRPDTGNKTNG